MFCTRPLQLRIRSRPRDQTRVAFDADDVQRRCARAAARNSPVRRTDRARCSPGAGRSRSTARATICCIELAVHLHEVRRLKSQRHVELRQADTRAASPRLQAARRFRSRQAAGRSARRWSRAELLAADSRSAGVSSSSMRTTSATALSATATSICGTRLRTLSALASSATSGSTSESTGGCSTSQRFRSAMIRRAALPESDHRALLSSAPSAPRAARVADSSRRPPAAAAESHPA